jgi:hypothetical protein
MYRPPFADSAEPVMKPAPSEARNTAERARYRPARRGEPVGICGLWSRVQESSEAGTGLLVAQARRPVHAGTGEGLRPAQVITCPPFADSVEPVMKPASSEARNTTQRAISSGSPRRPVGISGRMFFSSTSFGTAITISVAM